jgi:hypothetical protein
MTNYGIAIAYLNGILNDISLPERRRKWTDTRIAMIAIVVEDTQLHK